MLSILQPRFLGGRSPAAVEDLLLGPMAGLTDLRDMRKRQTARILVIQAASGAGKSSFLRAGLWPRLKRDSDFAPLAIVRPAQGIISGPDGLGRCIAPWFEA